jgi:hypothetical protein
MRFTELRQSTATKLARIAASAIYVLGEKTITDALFGPTQNALVKCLMVTGPGLDWQKKRFGKSFIDWGKLVHHE